MLTIEKKITYLENSLNKTELNYADSFKTDIIIFIDEFESNNEKLMFLNKFTSYEEIDGWIAKLTSRIVLKFDPEFDQISDFIFDFIENG